MHLRRLLCLGISLLCLRFRLSAHDPHDPFIAIAVSPSFAQDQTVMVATDYLSFKVGVYALMKSVDAGVTWSVLGALPNTSKMLAIAFSPAYSLDQTIYVAGPDGLFGTTDSGATWSLLQSSGLTNLALSPNFANDDTLFVLTGQRAILESTDRGQTWNTLSSPAPLTGALNAIAVSPNFAADGTLLVATANDGIFESRDSGASWQQVTAGMQLPGVTGVAFSPDFVDDQTAVASTMGSGVLVSADGGQTWTPQNSGITDLNVTSVSFAPGFAAGAPVWISTAGAGVFQSADLSGSWTAAALVSRMPSGLTTTHYRQVTAAAGANGTVLFLAMYEGAWISRNSGASWQYLDTQPTRLIRNIKLSPDFQDDQTVFASSYGGGNLWSVTGGSSWTFQNTGMQSAYADSSGFSPDYADDGTVFSAMPTGLQRSVDRGATWQLMYGQGGQPNPRALAVSPNFVNDSTVLLGMAGQHPGVYVSTDGGETWGPSALTGVSIISIAISPAFATDRTAFAASPTNGVYQSTDGGMTWNPVGTNSMQMALVAVSPSFASDKTVLAAALTGGLFLSIDGGASWSLVPGTSPLRAMDLKFSPNWSADHSFFAGTVEYGLLKFANGGSTVKPIFSFPDNFVTAVGLSPNLAKDHTLFAAGYHGIYKSTNGGTSWTYLDAPARIEDTRNVLTPTTGEPPAVTYTGSWSPVTPAPDASSNSYWITSTAHDTATLKFTGSGVRWISWTGPQQGKASVVLDGVWQGSVTLTAPADNFQQPVWEIHDLPCAAHTLSIAALPATGQTVSVDAFDVWVDTCLGP
jgi:photosystem II stability/assembly factor-like uncharacterized protein